ARPVLAVVRGQRLGPRHQLRLVPAGLRHLVLAGGRGRAGRHRRLLPALRVHRGGGQERLGGCGGTATKVIALIVVSALTVIGGVMGFDLIMRMQTVITVVTAVLTIGFIALVADKIHWHTVTAIPGGSTEK